MDKLKVVEIKDYTIEKFAKHGLTSLSTSAMCANDGCCHSAKHAVHTTVMVNGAKGSALTLHMLLCNTCYEHFSK